MPSSATSARVVVVMVATEYSGFQSDGNKRGLWWFRSLGLFSLLFGSPISSSLSPAGFLGSDWYQPGSPGSMGVVGGRIRLRVVFSIPSVLDSKIISGSCDVGGCDDGGGVAGVLVASSLA